MSHRRLTMFLARLLGPAALVGCGYFEDIALDDEACLTVAAAEGCPTEDEAADALLGTQTASCSGTVVEVGGLVSDEEVGGLTDTGAEGVRECCYAAALDDQGGACVIVGRPLLVRGRPVSARRADRADWASAPRPDVSGLTPGAREALAAAWTEAGLLEHASIPAFARVALDLAALGAPPELLARTAAAMQDEVAHAEACFALASAYAGRPVGPGTLPVARGRRPSLRRLAVETFREGCVGETLAVGLAAAQLREATDPAVCAVLGRILRDESRHAALAWDTVRWALARGGRSVRRAVAAEAARLRPAPGDPGSTVPGVDGHGLPRPGHARAALEGVLEDVIRPATEALLAA